VSAGLGAIDARQGFHGAVAIGDAGCNVRGNVGRESGLTARRYQKVLTAIRLELRGYGCGAFLVGGLEVVWWEREASSFARALGMSTGIGFFAELEGRWFWWGKLGMSMGLAF
jgi:hypothetical protein